MEILDLDIEFRMNLILDELNKFIDYLDKNDNEFDDLFDRKFLIDLNILIDLFDLKLNCEINELKDRINKMIKEEILIKY